MIEYDHRRAFRKLIRSTAVELGEIGDTADLCVEQRGTLSDLAVRNLGVPTW